MGTSIKDTLFSFIFNVYFQRCFRFLILSTTISQSGGALAVSFSKEVIQPQVPLGGYLYDFTLVTNHTVVNALQKVGYLLVDNPLPWCDGRCDKARERIHRDILIQRLLAIPTSWSRVADSNRT